MGCLFDLIIEFLGWWLLHAILVFFFPWLHPDRNPEFIMYLYGALALLLLLGAVGCWGWAAMHGIHDNTFRAIRLGLVCFGTYFAFVSYMHWPSER